MTFEEYEQKHNGTLIEKNIRQVAINSASITQCDMLIQSFKIGLKMIKMGMIKELPFTGQQINIFRTTMKDIFKKDYQLNVINILLLMDELFEIEEGSKQLFLKNEELRKDIEAHLSMFPLPADTPAEICEIIESKIYDNTITRDKTRREARQ